MQTLFCTPQKYNVIDTYEPLLMTVTEFDCISKNAEPMSLLVVIEGGRAITSTRGILWRGEKHDQLEQKTH